MSGGSKFRKFVRLGLVGSGATMIVSAITGIYGAFTLIEPSDKEAVGLTPWDFVGFYAGTLLVGAALVVIGLRLKKS